MFWPSIVTDPSSVVGRRYATALPRTSPDDRPQTAEAAPSAASQAIAAAPPPGAGRRSPRGRQGDVRRRETSRRGATPPPSAFRAEAVWMRCRVAASAAAPRCRWATTPVFSFPHLLLVLCCVAVAPVGAVAAPAASQRGTSGADTLAGARGADRLSGLAGAD